MSEVLEVTADISWHDQVNLFGRAKGLTPAMVEDLKYQLARCTFNVRVDFNSERIEQISLVNTNRN